MKIPFWIRILLIIALTHRLSATETVVYKTVDGRGGGFKLLANIAARSRFV